MRTTARLRTLLALVTLTVFLLTPAAAFGHAELIGSSPADGSAVATAPTQLQLRFSQKVVLSYTHLTVRDGRGAVVASTAAGPNHIALPEGDAVPVVTVPLQRLPDGIYKVSWATVSKDDAHPVNDAFVFAIGANATAPAPAHASRLPQEPTPRLAEVLIRWVVFLAIAALAGLLIFAALAPRLAARIRRPAIIAAVAAIVGGVALVVQSAVAADALSDITGILTGTGAGTQFARLALVLLAIDGILGRRYRLGAVWAVLAAACGAFGSHASSFGLGPELALAIHLAAAAIWTGLLVAAVLIALPALRSDGDDRAAAIAALRGYMWIAGPAAGAVAVTGLFSAGQHAATIDALLTTIYGAALIAKMVLIVPAIVLGYLVNRLLRADARGVGGRVRRAVPIELGLLALAVLAAAVLAAGAPARGVRFEPVAAGPAPSLIATTMIGQTTVTFAANPNRPGASIAAVKVLNRFNPQALTGVTVAVGSAAPVAAAYVGELPSNQATAPGTDTTDSTPTTTAATVPPPDAPSSEWDANVAFPRAGATPITIHIERAGATPIDVRTAWVVGGGPVPKGPDAVVSTARLEPIMTTLAVVLALALLAAAGVAWRRRTP
jgi:copper transport protein